MTGLSFTSFPLLFTAIAALGLGLTWALYFRAPLPFGAGARRALALLTALAWLALAWFGAGALLNRDPVVYHAPAVVLALDASESYAALGAREAAQEALRAARAHYEASGFRVIDLAFGESVALGAGSTQAQEARDARNDEDLRHRVGELTSFPALARALDSLQIPNLQAVILASDGRASNGAGASVSSWAAPVHPLRLDGDSKRVQAEAQGEHAEIDWTRPEEGADLVVTWSASRRARAISAELRADGRTLWTGMLRPDASSDAAGEWTPMETEFRLPASLTRGARPEAWTLHVRPEPNPRAENDRVDLRFKGLERARDHLARPLSSLEERGLVDALTFGDSGAVSAGELSAVRVGAEDILWLRAGRTAPAGVAGAVIEYTPARDVEDRAQGAERIFSAEARVHWREDGAEFLPAGVLRLGDLGVETLRLQGPREDVEALAWAEQGGRKGLLLWRKPGSRAFGMALPPLWKPAFSAGTGPEARAAASRWVRGAAAWARAHGRARVPLPDPVIAGRPFTLEARFPAGEGDFKNIERYDLLDNETRIASARGRASARFDSVTLPAGGRNLSIRQGSRLVWTGAADALAPRDVELRKLGIDGRALAEIAAASDGSLVRADTDGTSKSEKISDNEIDMKISWPALPGGQARETRSRPLSLAPAAVALLAALLLCAAWALRKRLQLD